MTPGRVVAGAERVPRRVEERSGCARAGSRRGAPTPAARPRRQRRQAGDDLPRQAGEIEHAKAAAPISSDVPRSGCRLMRTTGTTISTAAIAKSFSRCALELLESTRRASAHRDLHQLRRLEAREPQVQPPARAVDPPVPNRRRREQHQQPRTYSGTATRESVCGGTWRRSTSAPAQREAGPPGSTRGRRSGRRPRTA